MEPTLDTVVVLATVDAMLVTLFFLFRVIPRSRPGAWQRIWFLAGVASLMFVLAEVAVLATGVRADDPVHQVPLFVSMLATTGCFFIAYLDAYKTAQRTATLALTDELTGLPNRRAFEQRVAMALEGGASFSVVYVDLDGFKRVNDTFGHERGDLVLKRVGAEFTRALRRSDTAARIGGDEFALLLNGSDKAAARAVAERALRFASEGLFAELGERRVGASMGIATNEDGVTATDVVEAADRAMYSAKRAGGGRVAASVR